MKKPVSVRPKIMLVRFSDEKGGPIRHRETESIKKLVIIVTRCGNHFGSTQVYRNVPSTYERASAE